MAGRGNFDDLIKQQLARAADQVPGNDSNTYNRLKLQELLMTTPPPNRPRVLMEPDMQEFDYPYTSEYDYVRPNSPQPQQHDMTPWEGIPRRRQRAYKR